MRREEHLICYRSYPFQPEQQEGGALIMDLFRRGRGREGWGEKRGVVMKGRDEWEVLSAPHVFTMGSIS